MIDQAWQSFRSFLKWQGSTTQVVCLECRQPFDTPQKSLNAVLEICTDCWYKLRTKGQYNSRQGFRKGASNGTGKQTT